MDRDLRDRNTHDWPLLSCVGFRSNDSAPGPPTGSVTPIHNQTWFSVPPRPDESDTAWNSRAEAAHQPVDAFYAAVQALPEFGTAGDAIARVRDFNLKQVPGVVDDLKRIQEMDPPRRRRRVPSVLTN